MNRADIIGAESFERGQRVEFWKMNGAGNDFIVLNNLVEKLPEAAFPALARRLCERHLSIGADGLIVVDAVQDRGDYRMRFYNSDGSLGEMCGNGARCVCRYGYETGLAGEKQTVETGSGSTTPASSSSTAPWRWTAPPGPAPMWSWGTPASPMR